MCICGIDKLNHMCTRYNTLYDVLSNYTSCAKVNDVIDELKTNDTLWSMAEQNNMHEDEMCKWVESHMNCSVSCGIFKEHGPAGGWPVIKIKCMDKVFFFDWAE